MTKYRTILSSDEIDNSLNSIPKDQALFLPTNKVIYANRKGNTATLKGLFFKTKAKIEIIDNESRIEMKTRFRLPLYFFVSFLLVFFCFFTYNLIFEDNVTINGNSNPNLLERFGFMLVVLIIVSIPIGIFIGLKTDFAKGIERELKLKKTPTNN